MKVVWLTLALLLSAPAAMAKDRDGNDQSDGKNSRGKCENADYCQDNDASPSFDNSPVIICVQPGACEFSGE